jgi:glycosyltransferase involved in cell wall biosynthesis
LKILIPWYRYPPFSGTSIGGLSVSIWELSKSLKEAKISVEFLCPTTKDSDEPANHDGMVVLRKELGTKLLNNRRLDQKDIDFLKGYDWIFSVNNFGAKSVSCIKESVFRQIHTVAHDRPVSSYLSLDAGPLEYFRMLIQRRREMSYEASLSGTRTICVSQYNLMRMLDHKLEVEENLHHIPNGINTSIFRPVAKEKKFDLIFIGRFQKLKGPDILFGAITILWNLGLKLRTVIVGNFDAREQEFCRNLVPKGCRDSLNFIGMIPHDRVPDLINASNVLVVPSRYESFSLPTLEAQACGVPVVASSTGGIPELLDENTCILVKSLNPDELARSIEKALSSTSLQETALNFGPTKASRYDSASVAKELAQLFQQST